MDYVQDIMKIRSWSANDAGVAKVGQGLGCHDVIM